MSMEVNEKSFNREVIDSDIPVFVFFWASWCTACKRTQEVVKELAEEYNGKFKICSVNVDRNFIISEKYNIKGVPSFVIFVDGKEVKRGVGAKSRRQLKEMMDEFV